MHRRSVRELVSEAWAALDRVTPRDAYAAQQAGALLVDVRDSAQRERDGRLPGALEVGLHVLEWRFDPDESSCLPGTGDLDARVILVCHEGYSSALAALRLRELGYRRATDVVGGFVAWRSEGLPVDGR